MRTRSLIEGLLLGGLGAVIYRCSKTYQVTGRLFIVKKAIEPTPEPVLPEEEDPNGYPEPWMSAQDLYLDDLSISTLPNWIKGGNVGINSLDRGDRMSQAEYSKITKSIQRLRSW